MAMAIHMTAMYSLTHGQHIAQHHPNIHDHNDHSGEAHSHNIHGVYLPVLADIVGSVGVITSTLLIRYCGWTGFDHIASLFIAVLIAASVWPFVQETKRLLGLDLGDEGERHVRSALNEVGGGRCAGCGWIFRSALLGADIVRSLRIQLGPWFVQAPTRGDRKGRLSRLDGVRVSSRLRYTGSRRS